MDHQSFTTVAALIAPVLSSLLNKTTESVATEALKEIGKKCGASGFNAIADLWTAVRQHIGTHPEEAAKLHEAAASHNPEEQQTALVDIFERIATTPVIGAQFAGHVSQVAKTIVNIQHNAGVLNLGDTYVARSKDE